MKRADDRQQDIMLLEALLADGHTPDVTRSRIERELRLVRAGISGERDAAYEINFHFGSPKNWLVIHDLRIEHGGRVAQIDHLLINRLLQIYVCESKRVGEGITVNKHGECMAFYGSKPYGIPSPFEQNRKHIAVLEAAFKDNTIELPRRLGIRIKPDLFSLILVSKNARISRPRVELPDIDTILKVDHLKARIFRDDPSVVRALTLIGEDTLRKFGERLITAHRPVSFNWRARFGLDSQNMMKPAQLPDSLETSGPTLTNKPDRSVVMAKSGDDVARVHHVNGKAIAGQDTKEHPKYYCYNCRKPVSEAVAKFCWNRPGQYDKKVYCMSCQRSS